MKIEDICDWYASKPFLNYFLILSILLHRVIAQGGKYPGMHNTPTERTNGTQKPLETKAQVCFKLTQTRFIAQPKSCNQNKILTTCTFFSADAYRLEGFDHLS